MNITRITHSHSDSPAVRSTLIRIDSVARRAGRVVHTTLWRSAVALVDHPSDAPPA
ncbi:MAG TPA: hypothetical protein VK163_09835 [Opitutaceae bacterium]|nr:hypothetical protein [Opitutaceae bacterium]